MSGPGSAPADAGPTRKRAPSNVRIEPPPAATVWIFIIGARILTPATSVSKARSNSPWKWETSVEVPPMSKPMTRLNPALEPVPGVPDHFAACLLEPQLRRGLWSALAAGATPEEAKKAAGFTAEAPQGSAVA